jgi:hypothetical protein
MFKAERLRPARCSCKIAYQCGRPKSGRGPSYPTAISVSTKPAEFAALKKLLVDTGNVAEKRANCCFVDASGLLQSRFFELFTTVFAQ